MDKFQLNDKLMTNGYLPTLATSKASRLNPIQLETIQKHHLTGFPLNRYELRNFQDKGYNTLKAYECGKTKAKKLTQQLKKYLFMVYINTRYMNVFKTRYFYRLMITTDTNNYHIVGSNPTSYCLIDESGCNAFTNIKSSLSGLRRHLTRKHINCKIIATNTIDKFMTDLHTHGIVTLDTDNPIHTESILEKYLDKQLGYDVNVSLTPLRYQNKSTSNQVVIDSSNYTDDSAYQAINQWLNYCYKSYRLAFINNYKDLCHWNYLTATDKQRYVFAIINSTRRYNPKWITKKATFYLNNIPIHKVITYLREYTGIRTSYSVSYKRKIKLLSKRIRLYRQVVKRLSIIYFEFTLFDVSQQMTLPIRVTIATDTKIKSNKYTWRDAFCLTKQKIHVEKILQRGRLSYQHAIENVTSPHLKAICVILLRSYLLETPMERILETSKNNYLISLFNSS